MFSDSVHSNKFVFSLTMQVTPYDSICISEMLFQSSPHLYCLQGVLLLIYTCIVLQMGLLFPNPLSCSQWIYIITELQALLHITKTHIFQINDTAIYGCCCGLQSPWIVIISVCSQLTFVEEWISEICFVSLRTSRIVQRNRNIQSYSCWKIVWYSWKNIHGLYSSGSKLQNSTVSLWPSENHLISIIFSFFIFKMTNFILFT